MDNVEKLFQDFSLPIILEQKTSSVIIRDAPYIRLRYGEPMKLVADNQVYFVRATVELTLCTQNKDINMEKQIEQKFIENNIVFDKNEEQSESGKFYEVEYII